MEQQDEEVSRTQKWLSTGIILVAVWRIFLNVRQLLFIFRTKNVPDILVDKISKLDFGVYRNEAMLLMCGSIFRAIENGFASWMRLHKGNPAYIWSLTTDYADSLTSRVLAYSVIEALLNNWLGLVLMALATFTNGLGATVAFYSYVLYIIAVSAFVSYMSLILTKHFGPEILLYLAVPINVLEMLNIMLVIQYILPNFCFPLPSNIETALRPTAEKVGYPISRVCMVPKDAMNLAPNAGYMGLLGVKIIIITESLLNIVGLTDLKSVLGHELGHWARGHMAVGMTRSLIYTITTCLVLAFCYGNKLLFKAFKFEDADPPHPVVGILVGWRYIIPLTSEVIQGVGMMFSYLCEYGADSFAVDLGLGEGLKNALLALTSGVGRFTRYDSWFAAWFVGHPDVMDRINRILVLTN